MFELSPADISIAAGIGLTVVTIIFIRNAIEDIKRRAQEMRFKLERLSMDTGMPQKPHTNPPVCTATISCGANAVTDSFSRVTVKADRANPDTIDSVELVRWDGVRLVHFRQKMDSSVRVTSLSGSVPDEYFLKARPESNEELLTDIKASVQGITAFETGFVMNCPQTQRPVVIARYNIPINDYKRISHWNIAPGAKDAWKGDLGERFGAGIGAKAREILYGFDPGSILRDIGKEHYLPYV